MKKRTRRRPARSTQRLIARLADARVDQLDQAVDRLRRDGAGAGVDAEPRHLVLRRQHALQHRQEALQVEELVERRRDVAGLQPIDRRRREVDAADDDVAGLLAGLLRISAIIPVMPPCCVPIAFRFGCAWM